MCNDVILTLFIYVFLYLLWCVLSEQRILLIAVHPCMLYSSHSPTSPVAQHTAPFYSIPHCHTHICSYPTYWYPLHHLVHSILGTKTSLSVTFYHTLLLCCVFLIYNNKPIFIFLPFFFSLLISSSSFHIGLVLTICCISKWYILFIAFTLTTHSFLITSKAGFSAASVVCSIPCVLHQFCVSLTSPHPSQCLPSELQHPTLCLLPIGSM